MGALWSFLISNVGKDSRRKQGEAATAIECKAESQHHANCFNSNETIRETDIVWRCDGAAKNVIVTGDFDSWSQSVPMELQDKFWRAKVSLDKMQGTQFKFLVDGEWRCSQDYPTVTDKLGNVNNKFI